MRQGHRLHCSHIWSHPIYLLPPGWCSCHLNVIHRPSSTSCYTSGCSTFNFSILRLASCFGRSVFENKSYVSTLHLIHFVFHSIVPLSFWWPAVSTPVSFSNTQAFVSFCQLNSYQCHLALPLSHRWRRTIPFSFPWTACSVQGFHLVGTPHLDKGPCISVQILDTNSSAWWICLAFRVLQQQITRLKHHRHADGYSFRFCLGPVASWSHWLDLQSAWPWLH